jgi:hypothetical protein
MARYGMPRALYTDWKNVYVRRPNQEERETGAEPLTQFGRMCAALGRSSRRARRRRRAASGATMGHIQDRLVKKLRRKRIADVDAANAFLDADHFSQEAAYGKAAVIHDYLYSRPNGRTREQCDRVFLDVMEDLGCRRLAGRPCGWPYASVAGCPGDDIGSRLLRFLVAQTTCRSSRGPS